MRQTIAVVPVATSKEDIEKMESVGIMVVKVQMMTPIAFHVVEIDAPTKEMKA